MLLPAENTISATKKLISEALSPLYSDDEARSIATVYLEDRFGLDRTAQSLNERRITESEINILNADLERLIAGEPVQYVTRVAHFSGMKFKVDGSVLIPRPETEELVRLVLMENDDQSRSMLDVGTGSGCIPIAIKNERPNWEVEAMDVSDEALKVSKENARSNSVEVIFHELDIFSDPKFSDLDILVSNPPYVGRDEADSIHKNVLVFEPHLALFPESDDGLSFYRRIGELGTEWLKVGGKLYFEINEKKGPQVCDILVKFRYQEVQVLTDIHGKDRFVRATWLG